MVPGAQYFFKKVKKSTHEFIVWSQEHHISQKNVKNRPTNSLIILDISYLSRGLRFYLDHGQRAGPLGMGLGPGPGPWARAHAQGPGSLGPLYIIAHDLDRTKIL